MGALLRWAITGKHEAGAARTRRHGTQVLGTVEEAGHHTAESAEPDDRRAAIPAASAPCRRPESAGRPSTHFPTG
jgi:hypothetical protein